MKKYIQPPTINSLPQCVLELICTTDEQRAEYAKIMGKEFSVEEDKFTDYLIDNSGAAFDKLTEIHAAELATENKYFSEKSQFSESLDYIKDCHRAQGRTLIGKILR